ncbi:hypothetical protein D3C85_1708960 [compost metagenome]
MFAFVEVIAEAVFVQAFYRYFHHLFTIGHDNAFICNQIRKVLFDGFFDLLLMPGLILVSFAVE